MEERDEPPRSAHLPAGYDEDDPYDGEDLSTYPDWWRRNVERFREYDMRPYRPPRFADGALTPEVIADLEAEFDVEIRLKSTDPGEEPQWEVWLDGDRVAQIERSREGDGHTRYLLDSAEFEVLVRDAAE